MGAKNIGRAAKYGWQAEKTISQGMKAERLGAKSAKSVDKSIESFNKLKPGKGRKAGIKAGYAARKGAKAGAVIGASTAASAGTVDYARKSKHQGIKTRKKQ